MSTSRPIIFDHFMIGQRIGAAFQQPLAQPGAMTGGVAGRLGAGGRLPVGKELAAV